ncbi:MAG TPA: tetratricopeptide repeat protein [Terracidiphilus sp.]|nr:tetratricopeptide repeat protein [Terracidiphilus sp.]
MPQPAPAYSVTAAISNFRKEKVAARAISQYDVGIIRNHSRFAGCIVRSIRRAAPIANAQRLALKVCADASACAGWMLVAQGGVMPTPYRCLRNSMMALCLFVPITAVALGEVFAELERRAAAGNSDAQFRMGLEYAVGQRVPLDLERAAYWYRKAAGHGNALARFNLGIAYHNGLGIARDDAESVRWFRKAADQGNADAEFLVGRAYDTGRGIAKDKAKAVLWYTRSDEGSANPAAEYRLGEIYGYGDGVPKDAVEAMRWYRKAGENGNVAAQCRLGAAYLLGMEVPQDNALAAEWLRKAAAQGAAAAQYQLGSMYQAGEGVAQDYAEAYFWFNLAAAAEKEPFRQEEIVAQRDAAASNLPETVLVQTQERVRQWNTEHSTEPSAE